MFRICSTLICIAGLSLFAVVRGYAVPGYGTPLTVTTGTVHSVASVGELSDAVNAVNAAGVPATILLADGTYQLGSLVLSLRCPGLIIRGASGMRENVILRGPDEGPGATLAHVFLVQADQITIADLTLGYCRNHGVQIRGESPYDVAGTRIHNCRLVNINEQFIKGSGGSGETVGATDGIIEHCLFEFTAGWAYQYYTGGIDIHRGVNWVVRDNLFRNLRNPTALPNVAEHAVHFWRRSSEPQNIVVERNHIINCDRGIGFGLSNADGGFNGGSSVIRNNMVVNDGVGGHTDVGIGLEYASDVQVDNNTVYIPSYWAPMEYRFAGTSNVVFRNNLVNSAIQLRSGAPPAVFSNNVEEVAADWFKDVSSGDLHLTPAATGAINRGVEVHGVETDIDGGPRSALGDPDVGADEYHPGWSRLAPVQPQSFAEGKMPTREIHVATGGSNTTGDGSLGRPYATIAHAANFAVPGCAIVVAPGVYAGGQFISDLIGTAEAPVWIRGASEVDRPVISGSNEGLHLTRVRYLVVENLEITGSNNNGINCDDGGDYGNPDATRFLLFRNVYLHDVGSGGNQDLLKLSGVDDYEVRDCTFTDSSAGGSGIDHVGCHNGLITGCTFTDMGSNAIQCKGGTANLLIRSCTFKSAGQRGINIGGSTGFSFFRPPLSESETNFEARAIQVVANVFRGGVTPVAFVGCVDCVVANNTIIDPEDWFFRVLQETTTVAPYAFYPCKDSAFVNNLVYFDRQQLKSTDVNVGSNTDPDSFFFGNNLWFAHDGGDSQPDLPGPEIDGQVGVDPLLQDPANEDYAITLASPAARSGAPMIGVLNDFTQAPFLAPPAIGAFEITGDLDLDLLPDVWELRYFSDTNRTAGTVGEDQDGDGLDDAGEFTAGTDPADPASRLAITRIYRLPDGRSTLEWAGVAQRTYTLYRAVDAPDSTNWVVVADQLSAMPESHSATVTNDARVAFFRVGVSTN